MQDKAARMYRLLEPLRDMAFELSTSEPSMEYVEHVMNKLADFVVNSFNPTRDGEYYVHVRQGVKDSESGARMRIDLYIHFTEGIDE